jgi:mannobiose 2-epimerase
MTAPAYLGLCLAALVCLPCRGAETAPLPAETRAELKGFAADAQRELRDNILPFWLANARDREHGGFHSFIGEDMKVRDDLPHGLVLTSRILWTFSAAYRAYRDPQYLEMARWAYRDLMDRFVDREDGGFLWAVRPDGKPAGPPGGGPGSGRKVIYGEAFAIYGLSEYYRATGDIAALQQAVEVYGLIEKNDHDAVNGGYFDVLDRQWKRVGEAPKGAPFGVAPKSQNSHIHILEAFANLLRAWPDEGLRGRERELVELTLSRIIDARTHHLILFMKDDWTPIGDGVSYGHDIELSWLLVEAAQAVGDPALVARARQESVAMARVANAQGIDGDGGVFTEGGPKGPTEMDKEWWEQAEAAVGFLNAYQVSGDPGFLSDSMRSWRFIQDKLVDRQHGDWHNTLRRDGTPMMELPEWGGGTEPAAKLSLWKCPYHNSRSCMQVIERVGELLGCAPGG